MNYLKSKLFWGLISYGLIYFGFMIPTLTLANLPIVRPPCSSLSPGSVQPCSETGTGSSGPGGSVVTTPITEPPTTVGVQSGWVNDCPEPRGICPLPDCNPYCTENCDPTCIYWGCMDPASTGGFTISMLPTYVKYMNNLCVGKISDFVFDNLPKTYESGITGTTDTLSSIPASGIQLKQWACVTQPNTKTCRKACTFPGLQYLPSPGQPANPPLTVMPNGGTLPHNGTKAYLNEDDLYCTGNDYTCDDGTWKLDPSGTSAIPNSSNMYQNCYKQCQGSITNSAGQLNTVTVNGRGPNNYLNYYTDTTPSGSCSLFKDECTDGAWTRAVPVGTTRYDYCLDPCSWGAGSYTHGTDIDMYTDHNSPTCPTTRFRCNTGRWMPPSGVSATPTSNCNKQCIYRNTLSAVSYVNHGQSLSLAYISTGDSCANAAKTFYCNQGSWEETSPTAVTSGRGLSQGAEVYQACTSP